jgi:hypothetical protein
MEGSRSTAVRTLAVERDFECSRLEKALLAQAYERVVPVVRRRGGQRKPEGQTPLPRSAERMQQVATGG